MTQSWYPVNTCWKGEWVKVEDKFFLDDIGSLLNKLAETKELKVVKGMSAGGHQSPLTSRVTLGKLLNFPEPQFPTGTHEPQVRQFIKVISLSAKWVKACFAWFHLHEVHFLIKTSPQRKKRFFANVKEQNHQGEAKPWQPWALTWISRLSEHLP